ncbi:MAG: 5'-methylthioadenosine/adenosylhomocysteine nucleosidase [Defluviitaleaceae bacterium]|nr:5'-methylthioadenosine/adenosylhomocysteine nucleosidase [Defluviitaleaceae bacterium]
MIAIIGAMEEEVSYFKSIMKVEELFEIASLKFSKGQLLGKEVIIVKSGVGKVNAAICTQILIDYFKPKQLINIGIAGSLRDDLKIGDVIAGGDFVYNDVDVTPFGYNKNQLPGMESEIIKGDRPLLFLAEDSGAIAGIITSGDTFVANLDSAERIREETDADCVEMESVAIAHTCFLNKIPFLAVRGISDLADGNASGDMKSNLDKAMKAAIKVTENVLRRI